MSHRHNLKKKKKKKVFVDMFKKLEKSNDEVNFNNVLFDKIY